MDDEARRREDIAQLRAAARSTVPEAYRVPEPKAPAAETSADPMAASRESYTTLFGVLTGGKSIREGVATAIMLGANGIAWIVLIMLLNLAQCSWWYEPGMYSGDYERVYRSR